MFQLKSATVLSVFAAAQLGAQAAPPGTDIYLAPLSVQDGRISVGAPVNITKRPGYDNQPSFTPDGSAILFTSVREGGQSDIYRYDLATQRTTRLTSTAESEYSAQVIPGTRRFSVVRVEKDSSQRLWSFDLSGTDPQLVLESLKPVGYHAWLDSQTVGLFMLGDPNALVVASTTRKRVDTVARNIGRSLAASVPRRGDLFYFVQRGADSTFRLLGAVFATPVWQTREMAVLPPGAEYAVWLTNMNLLTAAGTTFFVKPTRNGPWVAAGDLATAGLHSISRLAVSPDEKWVAFVANEPRS